MFAAVAAAALLARSPLTPLVGTWIGHTRTLQVTRAGTAREVVDDGCCTFVVALDLKLSHPRRVGRETVATATVVHVRVGDRKSFPPGRKPPRVGDVGTLRLRGQIVTDSLTGDIYCGPRARAGACGA
ncbi:MAG: hypothetical protein JO073_13720 [Actinobacteria bacterium]|nr:hypothetical protein [Actinomycetota bacterium]